MLEDEIDDLFFGRSMDVTAATNFREVWGEVVEISLTGVHSLLCRYETDWKTATPVGALTLCTKFPKW